MLKRTCDLCRAELDAYPSEFGNRVQVELRGHQVTEIHLQFFSGMGVPEDYCVNCVAIILR